MTKLRIKKIKEETTDQGNHPFPSPFSFLFFLSNHSRFPAPPPLLSFHFFPFMNQRKKSPFFTFFCPFMNQRNIYFPLPFSAQAPPKNQNASLFLSRNETNLLFLAKKGQPITTKRLFLPPFLWTSEANPYSIIFIAF